MNHLKRCAGIFLALVMVFAMTVPVFADETTGSITIKGTQTDKIYVLYKIFDLTYSGDNVAYTIDGDWTAFFESEAGSGYIVDADTGNLNRIVVGETVRYINITEANVVAFSRAAQVYALTVTPDESTTGTGSDVIVSGLPLGYYLVYPFGASDIKDGYSCVCSLTSTVPNAEVNIKAEYPDIEKTDDTASADVGKVVSYEITGEVPDTTGFVSYTYKITDTMSAGLTFNEDVKVTIDGTDVTANCTVSYAGNGFTLTIPVEDYQGKTGKTILVTYTAVVNENAVAKVEKNRAVLEYSNDPDGSTTVTPPDEETVYSARILINKVDAQDQYLAGAKFVLKNGEGKFYNLTDGVVSWVDSIDHATVVATDDQGTASFDGLADGTYYLEETEAPAGYNKLTEAVAVTVSGNEEDVTTLTVTSDKIVNQTGSQLPSTGGMGTTVFYTVGSILVLGAVILLVTKRRMSAA